MNVNRRDFHLRRLGKGSVFFPALAKGGLGGVVWAQPIPEFSEGPLLCESGARPPRSLTNGKPNHNIRSMRPHPPWPPLYKEGKGTAPASRSSDRAVKGARSAAVPSVPSTPTFHDPSGTVPTCPDR
jgi:hypothetical protein